MTSDKRTIGIAKRNASALLAITSSGRFASEMDAAKFAMAYAIKLGLKGGNIDGAETKWNVGSVDPDGSLRSLLDALYPQHGEPYRLAEYLMNEGIAALQKVLDDQNDLYDTIFPVPPTTRTTVV